MPTPRNRDCLVGFQGSGILHTGMGIVWAQEFLDLISDFSYVLCLCTYVQLVSPPAVFIPLFAVGPDHAPKVNLINGTCIPLV